MSAFYIFATLFLHLYLSLSLIAIFFSTWQYLPLVLMTYVSPKNDILKVHEHIFLECAQNSEKSL
jgi:hypothetical protein